MSTFNVTKLANHRVLVTGDTDVQSVVFDSTEWDEIKGRQSFSQADTMFAEKIAEFFAPLTEAADAAKALAAKENQPDEAFFVTLQKGIMPTQGENEVTAVLSKDAAILRMLDNGDTSRLIWVGASIEITAK